MGLFSYLKSTIISKVVMAVTGVILLLFLFGHMAGNLQIFLGREVFNTYAHFLQSLGELLWVIRIVLFLALVFHIITSIRLKILNWSAKPTGYKVKNYLKATFNARTMFWTGLLIFCFLVFHLLHYTTGTLEPEIYGHKDYYESNADFAVSASAIPPQALEQGFEGEITVDGEKMYISEPGKVVFERHDAYQMVIRGFQNPIASVLYIIGMIILAFHIMHAIQSAFQTLGLNHPNSFPVIERWSIILGVLLALGYIAVPVSILLGLTGGGV